MGSVNITKDQYRKLFILARRTLHTAYVWNDHNFDQDCRELALESSAKVGIDSIEASNEFFTKLPFPHLEEASNKSGDE